MAHTRRNDGILVLSGPVSHRVSDSDPIRKGLPIAQAIADTDHDFLHVHTKVPDEAAHKRDPKHKRDVISLLDRGLDELAETLRNRDDILLAITADHSTPSGSPLIHSGEPVRV